MAFGIKVTTNTLQLRLQLSQFGLLFRVLLFKNSILCLELLDLDLLLIGHPYELLEHLSILALQVSDPLLRAIVPPAQLHAQLLKFLILERVSDLGGDLCLAAGLQALVALLVQGLVQEEKLAREFSVLVQDDLLEFHVLRELFGMLVTLRHHHLFQMADLLLRL